MKIGDFVYILFLAGIGIFLAFDQTRALFTIATNTVPQLMGFFKFALLATSGELLSRRIKSGKWSFKGINILTRAFVWGIIGFMITYVFPLFSAGTIALVDKGLLPAFSDNFRPFGENFPLFRTITISFWTSLLTNIVFGFEMMIFHRLTDTLIEEGRFWKKWNVVETWKKIDWKSIFGFVLPSIFWFWLPMHTITFSLPKEYQVLMASALGIALGMILSIAKPKK